MALSNREKFRVALGCFLGVILVLFVLAVLSVLASFIVPELLR